MSDSTAIFWFSGTGNSLYVAEKLAGRIPGADLNAVVADMPSAFPDATHLILVSPVYAWALPQRVVRFVNALPLENISNVSIVLTHGGGPGGAGANSAKLFSQRGIRQVNVYSLRMVSNYPPFGGAPKPEKVEQLLCSAEKKLDEIIEKILSSVPHPPSLGTRLLLYPSQLMNRLFRRGLKKAGKKFSATDACTGCGTCRNVCPVGNITLRDGKPHWGVKCEQCFACFHWCPEKAVLFGPRTARQVRYHHPDVSLKEIIKGEGWCAQQDSNL